MNTNDVFPEDGNYEPPGPPIVGPNDIVIDTSRLTDSQLNRLRGSLETLRLFLKSNQIFGPDDNAKVDDMFDKVRGQIDQVRQDRAFKMINALMTLDIEDDAA